MSHTGTERGFRLLHPPDADQAGRAQRWLALLPALLMAWAGASPAGATESADPAYYVRKGTWYETMIASREALLIQETAAGMGLALPDFGGSDFTILAWIRTTVGGTIFSKSSAQGAWAERGSKAFFVGGGRLGFDAAHIGVFSGGTAVADGKWHHVAVTWHCGTKVLDAKANTFEDFPHSVEFFVDGRLDGGEWFAPPAVPDAGTHVVRIGLSAKGFRSPNGFNGDIDEVRIYRRKLVPLEIRAWYEMAPKRSHADCVGHWGFDEDASDRSGNGNHGVIKGATAEEGRVGRALRFDGGSSVEISVATRLNSRRRLWELVDRDFSDAAARTEIAWERDDRIWEPDWQPGNMTVLAERYADVCGNAPFLSEQARTRALGAKDITDLQAVRRIYGIFRRLDLAQPRLLGVNFKALRLAIEDLTRTFGERYPKGKQYLARLSTPDGEILKLLDSASRGDERATQDAHELVAIHQESLLGNPLLDFDRLLVVKRHEKNLGLPMNYEGNPSMSLRNEVFDNEIAILSPICPEGKIKTLFKPQAGRFVGDVDLHFDAARMLFSMQGQNGRWQIFELNADGTGLRQLPLIEQPDVDNYDACYLPDDNVLFTSSACFTGVPCVAGFHHVANLFRFDTPTGRIRRLTFEQDHDWCPTVLHDGRILYTRWEYSDLPHYASRFLFHMNPDGTGQMEYYGSNSYWPTATFFARPVPDHPTKFVAIAGGHHGAPRMGELVLFDLAKGRREAEGVIQRIPGRGRKVEPIILDNLADRSWPKFLHPYPLSEKYVIVSARPTPKSKWGIYLADVFDNLLLLKELEGQALLEPLPLRKTRRPPVIPDRVEPQRKDALVYLTDVYAGDGLKGVPRGTVKKLRVFTYQFAYQGMGGQQNRVGLDGPWDVKRVMGTVPVEPDGSACFRVPANTPISVQPLDEQGEALQLMRSWMTAMPGEQLSCVGCHEPQSTPPPVHKTLAVGRSPSEIAPWYGPTRGFSFRREVQPVLDRYCVGCHNGQPQADGQTPPDLRSMPDIVKLGTKYPPSYYALRCFVRTNTLESDMHLLMPCEFHADTNRLVQLLKKGHYGVDLDAEAWDRLYTWIDLNTPAQGTWHEIVGMDKVARQRDRRRAMLTLYAGIDEDPEAVYPITYTPQGPSPDLRPAFSRRPAGQTPQVSSWPFDGPEAKRRQRTAGPAARSLDLGSGQTLDLVRIPAGGFVMGDPNGDDDERPVTPVRVEEFWMGKFEVTNEQFRRFAPSHDSRFEPGDFIQLGTKDRGYSVNDARQPVVRVSHVQAMAFCRWLSAKTRESFTLPTEGQWEYACRAGTSTPLGFGGSDINFSPWANLADAWLRQMDTFEFGFPSNMVPPWRPAIESVMDNFRVSAPVGSFGPNPWGLHDMHGNVSEWTRTTYRPYPYREDDGRNDSSAEGPKVVRGGSWYDRPRYARSGYRMSYPAWQKVYDVGFRVVCSASGPVTMRTCQP